MLTSRIYFLFFNQKKIFLAQNNTTALYDIYIARKLTDC